MEKKALILLAAIYFVLIPVIFLNMDVLPMVEVLLALILLVFLPGILLLRLLGFTKLEFFHAFFLIQGLGFIFLALTSYLSLVANTGHAIFPLLYLSLVALIYLLHDKKNKLDFDFTFGKNEFMLLAVICLCTAFSLSYKGLSYRLFDDGMRFYEWSGLDEMNRVNAIMSLGKGEYPPMDYWLGKWPLYYHYIFHLVCSMLIRYTSINALTFYFKVLPLLTSLITPLSVYGFISYFWGKKTGVFSIILLFLTGSAGFIPNILPFWERILYLLPQPLWWDNNFGSDSFFTLLGGSYHIAFALNLFLLASFLFIHAMKIKEVERKKLFFFFAGVTLGLTSLTQVHTFIVGVGTIGMFTLLAHLSTLKRTTKESIQRALVIIAITSVILSLVSFLISPTLEKMFSSIGFVQRLSFQGLTSILSSYLLINAAYILGFAYLIGRLSAVKKRGGICLTDLSMVLLPAIIVGAVISSSFFLKAALLTQEGVHGKPSFDVIRELKHVFPVDGAINLKYTKSPKYFVELDVFRLFITGYRALGFNPESLYKMIEVNPLMFILIGFSAVFVFLLGNYFIKALFGFLYLIRCWRVQELSKSENLYIFSLLLFSFILPSLLNMNNITYILYFYLPLPISIYGGRFLATLDYNNRIVLISVFLALLIGTATVTQTIIWAVKITPYTLVPHEEVQALNWIKENTMENSFVIYSEKNMRAPILSERKTIFSHDYLFATFSNPEQFLIDREFVRSIYGGNVSNPKYENVPLPYYIYIGEVEKKTYGETISKYVQEYDFAKEVYNEEGVQIFKVDHSP